MVRKREDVLRSITALLSEVNGVALAIGRISPKPLPPIAQPTTSNYSADEEGLISRNQADAITQALLRIQSASTANANTKIINALVCKTLNSAVESWLHQNLEELVEEVVDEQITRSQARKWGG